MTMNAFEYFMDTDNKCIDRWFDYSRGCWFEIVEFNDALVRLC